MFKKFILIALCAITSLDLYAQRQSSGQNQAPTAQESNTGSGIKGRVLDANDRQALPNVAVLYGQSKGLLSDEHGRFSVLLPGDSVYEIRLRYTGYESATYKGTLSAGQQLDLGDLWLKPAANQLSEIVVSAGATSFSNAYAGSNTYISPKLLREIQPMGTEEILRQVPGLNVIGDMGLSNRPNISIRGSYGRRSYKVLLLEDGSFIAPAPYMGPGAYYNPPADRIEAIRVIKGAETLLYGPNNMFGVVNYITRRPPSEPEVMFKLSGGQRAYTTAQAGYGGTWNQLGADVQMLYKRFDGFMDNSDVEVFNLHTKFYFELDERQSFYFKLGFQRERNNASLSAQTPFTFDADPVQNPFDADEFTSRRYALDVLHKYASDGGWSLTSKLYGADFARDWWRQKTTLVRADELRAYLGESIYQDRYRYMDPLEFDADDYVRVGRLINGREGITNSQWNYTFAGFQQQVEKNWEAGAWTGDFLAGARVHREIYLDQLLSNDSSRWARSGQLITDLKYDLWSAAFWAKHQFQRGRLNLSPLLRFEYVDMIRADLLASSLNPALNPDQGFELSNSYPVLLPGLAVDVLLSKASQSPSTQNQVSSSSNANSDVHAFGSLYRGFIAPNDQFAFLIEQDGVVSTPDPGDELNMKPEISMNLEAGLRGTIWDGMLSGQVVGFHNRINNYYSAGRGELFQSLGQVWIHGAEISLDWDITPLTNQDKHRFSLSWNATFLQSSIRSGVLRDRELSGGTLHSSASAQELIDRINAASGVLAYTLDASGQEVLLPLPLSTDDLPDIEVLSFNFGEGGLEGYEAPYTPRASLHARLAYRIGSFSAGLEHHYIAAQYAEYANFLAESSDGSIGQLPGYHTYDAQFSYRHKSRGMNWEFFLIGKNLSNEIYRASRLNRVASGIFPGGFRQVNAGIGLVF